MGDCFPYLFHDHQTFGTSRALSQAEDDPAPQHSVLENFFAVVSDNPYIQVHFARYLSSLPPLDWRRFDFRGHPNLTVLSSAAPTHLRDFFPVDLRSLSPQP
mmetsp:Transcript_41464/g.130618  ORF Transcript_41464/g.130618 Transcript_41464/m.130618 type:complete len:102 (+) Transcript_41464:1538-1843(+)